MRDAASGPSSEVTVAQFDDVARQLLARLDAEAWIARSKRAQRRIESDLADWLAEQTSFAEAELGEWLVDHDAIEEVFASDEQLAVALAEVIAAVVATPSPEAPEPPDPLDAIVAKLARPWYRPITSPGDGVSSATKFGGIAFIPAGESWPRCRSCDDELPLFVQLDLASLPAELGHPHREGLVQLFYCTKQCEIDCSAWDAGAKSVVTRWLVPTVAEPVTARGTRRSHGFVPTILERWQLEAPELAAYGEDVGLTEDERELMDERDEELRASDQRCHLGDKLAGWPRWIQEPSYPACPICRTRMRYLLQLDSNGLCGHQFGDVGAGHLFQCPRHPDGLAFAWACH